MAQAQIRVYDVLLQPYRDEMFRKDMKWPISFWFLFVLFFNLFFLTLWCKNSSDDPPHTRLKDFIPFGYGDDESNPERNNVIYSNSASDVNLVTVGKSLLALETALLTAANFTILKRSRSRSAKMIFFKITIFGALTLSLLSDPVIILSMPSCTDPDIAFLLPSHMTKRISLGHMLLVEKYTRFYCDPPFIFVAYLLMKFAGAVSLGYKVFSEFSYWLYVRRHAPRLYRRQAVLAEILFREQAALAEIPFREQAALAA